MPRVSLKGANSVSWTQDAAERVAGEDPSVTCPGDTHGPYSALEGTHAAPCSALPCSTQKPQRRSGTRQKEPKAGAEWDQSGTRAIQGTRESRG